MALVACGQQQDIAPSNVAARSRTFYVWELEFRDSELNTIAQRLTSAARLRRIDTVNAPSRVEALVMLETTLGATPRALHRFNSIVMSASSADSSSWAAMRKRARHRFNRRDVISARVQTLLDDWERHKLRVVAIELSDSQGASFYHADKWEAEFHEFILQKPIHAGTWGWLVLSERSDEVQRQYGRRDAMHAYRYYLELTRLATEREARGVFVIPGVEIGSR